MRSLPPKPGLVYSVHYTDRRPIQITNQEVWKETGSNHPEIASGTYLLLLELVRSEVSGHSHSCKCLLPDGTVGWIELYENLMIRWDDNPDSCWLEEAEK